MSRIGPGNLISEGAKKPPFWRRPLYRGVQKVQRAVCGRVFIDPGGDQHATVYVAGGGKSGTTWLAELINYRNEYRYMWEPLTPPRVPLFWHFVRGQYLRPENRDPRYAEPLRALVTGRLRHPWVDHLNCSPFPSQRLIKDVHANLMLGWFHRNLPGLRIVFIIRHPLAVLVSRMDSAPVVPFHEFDPSLERFLEQKDLVEDFLEPFTELLRSARSLVEQHALWWCVEHFVPLSQFRPTDIHIVFYERLRSCPEEEIPRLARYLDTEIDQSVYAKMRRPSRTAGYGNSLSRGIDPATAWRRRLSRADVRQAMRVLNRFGLDVVYDEEPNPHTDGLLTFMGDTQALLQPA